MAIYTTRTDFSYIASSETRASKRAVRSFGWQVTADENAGGGDPVHVVFFYATAGGDKTSHTVKMPAIEYFDLCDNLASDPRTARQHIEEVLTDFDALVFDDVSGEFMTRSEYIETRDECAEMVRHEKAEGRGDLFV
jgi:hypothetical protein